MNQKPLTFLTAAVLLVIFALLLFTFQVRQTEVAVVTTFGQYSRGITEPGFNLRWPRPIQRIYKFENRLQSFERKFEQTTTRDGRSILVTVFVGWRIADPHTFLMSFNGDVIKAEQSLENLVRNAKNGVLGRYQFGDLISPQAEELKFDVIENEMLAEIQPQAEKQYGIDIHLLGIKQVGLPESVTERVFERMREERQRLVKQFTGEGEARAQELEAEANRKREEILAEANAEATIIRGQADAEAANSYAAFEQHPELAIFLYQLRALEQSLKERSTLILDQQTPPFNMLNGQSVTVPAVTKKAATAPAASQPSAVGQTSRP